MGSIVKGVYQHAAGDPATPVPDLLNKVGDSLRAAWTPYTPTLTGMTLGNGTVSAAYCRVGSTVHVRAKITLGSTSTMDTNLVVGMPATCVDQAISMVNLYKSGVGVNLGMCRLAGVTASIYAVNPATGVQRTLGPTIPFTWAAGDYIVISITYEAAS